MTMGLRALLDDVPLFKGLTAAELDTLFNLSEVRRLEAGKVLFAEGSVADALWVVMVGDVEVAKDKTVLAEVGPGSVIGEISLFLDKARRSATVTAICPVTLLRIPNTAFRKLINADDVGALKVVNNVAGQLALRLVALNERLLSNGRKGLSVARSELRRTVL